MNFWKNNRYKQFEQGVDGDPLRGSFRKDFPWPLGSTTAMDREGDQWEIRIECTSIVPHKIGKRVEATFRIEAACLLGDKCLTGAGFDAERVGALYEHARSIELDQTVQKTTELHRVEALAKEMIQEFQTDLFQVWSLERKRQHLLQALRSNSVSRFSTPFHV